MSKSLSKDYWSKTNKWFIDSYNSTFIESIKHAPVKLREDLAVMSSKLIDADTILDLGCGPSRVLAKCLLSIPNSHGIGLDFSDAMIHESKTYLESMGLENRVKLVKSDLLELKEFPKASISIALGLFDYIEEPLKILKKASISSSLLVASWPSNTPRNYLRKFRYSCPVYRYNLRNVKNYLKEAGYKYIQVINLGALSGFVTISKI